MADKLFSDIISGQIYLDIIQEWLSGKNTEVISGSLSRTDFALFVLKHIQEETNKFLPVPVPPSTAQISSKNPQTPEEKSLISESNEKNSELELKSNQRTPFQVINKVTPSRTSTPPFYRHLNNGYEFKRDAQQGPPGLDGRIASTSTPVHHHRNSSRSSYFPISPPNSFHSDHSSSHTPRSSKSSRFNSSPGLPHFSPNSPQSPPFSPSSPQYSDNFPDLSGKSRQRAPQSPCLGDFITTKPASQKSRKRIKPTQLSTPEKDTPTESKKGNQISFGNVHRPFVPMSSTQTEVKEKLNFDEERNLLKQKRTEHLKSSQDNPLVILPTTPPNLMNNFSDERQEQTKPNNSVCLNISGENSLIKLTPSPQSVKYVIVNPNPNLVTNLERITRLASIYSACLDSNLVPNVTLELYNIFTLLTAGYKSKVSESVNSSKGSVISDNKDSNSSSGHCNSLLENLYLTDKFMHDESNSISSEETLIKRQSGSDSIFSSVHDCVMFSACVLEKQIHTIECLDKGIIRLLIDNERLSTFLPQLIPRLIQVAETKEAREEGPAVSKKQLPIENGPVLYHNETDNRENFSSLENFNFFKKQRDLFYEILHEWKTKNSDNLWVSKRFPQRIQTLFSLSSDPVNMMHLARLFCAQMTSSKSEPGEELELPGVCRDKLSRLQARFSKPAETPGPPRPPPAFPAEQQFYQQFLQLAAGSTFLHHVSDCLVHRLCLLNRTDFFTDGLSVEDSKSQVLACVSNSCLVAKFLGLVTFLPYRSNTPLAPDTLQAQIIVREQVVPPVSLLPQLQRALATNRLVVTVPWLVAFLGMMDSVAPHLAGYRPLLQTLVSVYKALPLPQLSSMANLLLRCSLGWLFDASFFPQDVFFSLLANCNGLDVGSAEPEDADTRDVVDQTLVSEVCPYLSHLRQLLAPSVGGRPGAARHITPVPALLAPATQASLAQTMELQLEECFLNGQSISFRSTVEMIIDRVSSSCIKLICSNVIASAKERATEEIKQRREELKITNKQEVEAWLAEQCRRAEAEVEGAMAEHCGARVLTALTSLLEPDLGDPALRRATHAICARRCRERIVNWLNSHIKLTDIFSKLIPGPDGKPTTESKSISDPMKPLKPRLEHRDSAVPPADMIIGLQNKLCECIEIRSSVMTEEQVVDLINRALETILHRNDVILSAKQTIFTLSVDLCIVLLAHAPALVSPTVVARLCALWSECGGAGAGPLERVMSARNTLLLCQGGPARSRESWQRLSLVLVELLKHSPPLLTPAQLETQCVALFRLDWPPMVLTLMGVCLSSMLEKIKHDPICKQKPKFVLMLEWVNEMTEDLSRDDVMEDLS